MFKLRKSSTSAAIAVNVWDTMGLEEAVSLEPKGPTMRDMEYIMDGHIKDGYEVNHWYFSHICSIDPCLFT